MDLYLKIASDKNQQVPVVCIRFVVDIAEKKCTLKRGRNKTKMG